MGISVLESRDILCGKDNVDSYIVSVENPSNASKGCYGEDVGILDQRHGSTGSHKSLSPMQSRIVNSGPIVTNHHLE